MIQANATPFHAIALEESGITSFKALKGKRVGVGPSGGPPDGTSKSIQTHNGNARSSQCATNPVSGPLTGAGGPPADDGQ